MSTTLPSIHSLPTDRPDSIHSQTSIHPIAHVSTSHSINQSNGSSHINPTTTNKSLPATHTHQRSTNNTSIIHNTYFSHLLHYTLQSIQYMTYLEPIYQYLQTLKHHNTTISTLCHQIEYLWVTEKTISSSSLSDTSNTTDQSDDTTLQKHNTLVYNILQQLHSLISQNTEYHTHIHTLIHSHTDDTEKSSTPSTPPAHHQFLSTYTRFITLFLQQLSITAEQQSTYNENIERYLQAIHTDETRIQTLKSQLYTSKQQHATMIHQYDLEIESLQSSIHELTETYTVDNKHFHVTVNTEKQKHMSAYSEEKSGLLREIIELENELEQLQYENIRIEQQLHRKKLVKQQDISTLIEKYDHDMEYHYENTKELEETYRNELQEKHELQSYFQNIDTEKERLVEEHESINQRRNQELHECRQLEVVTQLLNSMFYDYYVKNSGNKGGMKKQDDKKGGKGGSVKKGMKGKDGGKGK